MPVNAYKPHVLTEINVAISVLSIILYYSEYES